MDAELGGTLSNCDRLLQDAPVESIRRRSCWCPTVRLSAILVKSQFRGLPAWRPREQYCVMKSPCFSKALLLLLLAAAAGALPSWGETVKDREGAVRNDRAALEKNARWLYNDWRAALAEGKKSGKPVLVVLRCVPCIACSGIDAQVLLEETELKPVMDQFVCVRVINANDLDLSLFQFDYDLSFSVLFFNGDGTLYGRYSSWTHQKNAQDKTTAAFRAAMEGALALHRGYPDNRSSLAGKLGPKSAFKTPIDIPTPSGKYKVELDWSGKVVPSCVHCHQIGDALRLSHRNRKEAMPQELIYPWPAPEAIGLTLAADRAARVESVAAGSIAAGAGFQSGDDLVSLEGQPLLSVADVSWVLHRAGSETLRAEVMRAGERRALTLEFPAGWRSKVDISRRAGTWGFRAMALGGLQLEALTEDLRAARGLQSGDLGLLVKHAGEYGKHAAAKKAGFQKGDVIVTLDGISGRLSESELIGRLLERPAGDKVKAVVLRGETRSELMLPVQ